MGSILFRLLLSAVVGLTIGLIFKDKNTSRVFALICIGAALITIISTEFFKTIDMPWYSDPSRLSAQVIAALGFIGAGFIWITDNKRIKGLSQSAALWYTAILGMIIGGSLSSLTWVILLFAFVLYFVGSCIVKRWE